MRRISGRELSISIREKPVYFDTLILVAQKCRLRSENGFYGGLLPVTGSSRSL
ncbi:MAG: hypothetical protein JW881_19365 [Spirochaetales bacterium]|nr:hypothetical protein [Spirochaetales bacterium]